MIHHAQQEEHKSLRDSQASTYLSMVSMTIDDEVQSMLGFTSGLSAYLSIRSNKLDESELQALLAKIHTNTRHIKYFSIAEAYQVRYIHPLQGNEALLNADFRSLPDRWPLVDRISRTGESALAGPVNLLQGGWGMPYRVPIMVNGKYWGMLGATIDATSFFETIETKVYHPGFDLGIKGVDGKGLQGGMIWGDSDLFTQSDSRFQLIDIPGGQWAIGIRQHPDASDKTLRWRTRSISIGLSVLAALLLYSLINNHVKLAEQAMHDSLTQLPNRALFMEKAHTALSAASRQANAQSALLFADLDGFKSINDAYGHKTGDAVLQAVAQRIRHIVRPHDTVTRWGGDEFIILLTQIPPEGLQDIIARLRNAVEQPIAYQGNVLHIGLSIGYAIYPDQAQNFDQLIHLADQHMYAEKQGRKSLGPA
ncbi:sensor domain-containing diguanylate cyclase [Curvibacter sp. CHRR-16]|uniref:sensor domain-containing diguanylate cyclase n=1 Tax=Curvibacter sp. CHRR-16 TaxID=2835872 RepID=UPI001BDA64B4|nr:diguanylate cyclase [Curvibacter sp. CHRR-16]MBT0568943.1 sensor domain-containing diguanylate cyclase [Curvibacter sp. CHRR-16]